MKANELMIGDWVTVRRPSNRREKVRVKSVIGNGTIEAKTKDGLVVFGELAVEPIPLTAEILEKNGFEKQNDGWYKITLEEENLIGVQPFENVNWIFGANVFPNIIEHLNILYVHELQHALRLCGIEKEIIL